MTISSSCKYCKHIESILKPPTVACICKKHGIGISSSNAECLSVVGCESFNYDGKGLTDLERSLYRNKKND